MALRRPLVTVAGTTREMPVTDAVSVEAGGTGATTPNAAAGNLGVLTLQAYTDNRDNLLPNASFELGGRFWTFGSGVAVSLQANAGYWGSSATWSGVTGTNEMARSDFVAVAPGMPITISADVLMLSAIAGQVYIDMQWYAADGTTIEDGPQNPITTNRDFGQTGTRQAVAVTESVPSGAVGFRFRFIAAGISGTGVVVGIQRIKIERGLTPTDYDDAASLVALDAYKANKTDPAPGVSGTGRVVVGSNVSGATATTAAVEVRELNLGGAQAGTDVQAPRIGFTWSGRLAGQLMMNSAGLFRFVNADNTGWRAVAAGAITANGDFSATGNGYITGDMAVRSIYASGDVGGVNAYFTGDVGGVNYYPSGNVVAGGNVSGVNGAFSGPLTATTSVAVNSTGNSTLTLSGPSTFGRELYYRTNALARWAVSANGEPETGSNAGTNWGLYRFADDGSYLGAAISANRATGDVGMGSNLNVAGNIATPGSLTAQKHYIGDDVLIEDVNVANTVRLAGQTNNTAAGLIFGVGGGTLYSAGPASITWAGSDLLTSANRATYLALGVNGAGRVVVASTINDVGFSNSAVEVRELNFGGPQTGADSESPRITFHWGGRIATMIRMRTDGALHVVNQANTASQSLFCQDINSYGNVNTTSLVSTGPIKFGEYTASTVPSAAAYRGSYVTIVDGAGPHLSRSDGTNWVAVYNPPSP